MSYFLHPNFLNFNFAKVMLLKEFIKETLKQVTEAINESQGDKNFYLDNVTSKGVHFDLAVTYSNAKKSDIEGKAGIGIEVIGLGTKLSAKVETDASKTTVNRIKFNITYPQN